VARKTGAPSRLFFFFLLFTRLDAAIKVPAGVEATLQPTSLCSANPEWLHWCFVIAFATVFR